MSRFRAGLRVKKEATFEDVETLAKMHKFSNALNACDEYLRSNMEQAKSERKLKELNPGAKKRSKEEMARMVAEAFSSKGKGKKEVRTTSSIQTHNHGTIMAHDLDVLCVCAFATHPRVLAEGNSTALFL